MSLTTQTNAPGIDGLLVRAIAGALRGAQEGELPLFAWTLGLPQPVLQALISECFPELGELEAMPPARYARLLALVPAEFTALVGLLEQQQSAGVDRLRTGWLARAVAAASFGERHLWQDLGLANGSAFASLCAHYFEGLYQRKPPNQRWKVFLFAELGQALDRPGMLPPGCRKCDHSPICFRDIHR